MFEVVGLLDFEDNMRGEQITNLKESDVGTVFIYIDRTSQEAEPWMLKSYNNDTETAFIVFKCNNEWNRFEEFTWQSCKYNSIVRWDFEDLNYKNNLQKNIK